MLDIKYIRENEAKIRQAIIDKGLKLNLENLLDLDEKRRTLKQEIDELRQKRNEIAKMVKNGKKDENLIKNGKEVKILLSKLENRYFKVKKEFERLMLYVPQISSKDTPVGKDENDNVVVEEVGKKPNFSFKPKDHIELGKALDIIDFERGVKVAGYRGYYLKNEGALLAMAIMMYALDKMAQHGYTPTIPPTIVKEFTLLGSGYFEGAEYNPKQDDIYQVTATEKEANGSINKDKKFLIGTAEPSLLAYYAGETLSEKDLPLKLCGFSSCYRSEIGSYGKDTKGLYRVHEFMKVEQVILAKADINESDKLQQEMMQITKEMYDEIGFNYYRILLMCTGEQSAGKYKYYDMEIWSPGSERWAETASASNFLDWQARRLDVKYVTKQKEKKYVYMINNTALPTPRIIIAILENFQQKDGSVKVPKVLQKWVGKELIKR